MGYKRQQARLARHENGDFAEKEQDYFKHRYEKAKPFNLRVFYRVPESDCLQVAECFNVSLNDDVIDDIRLFHPLARVIRVKKSPCERWKPLENISRKTIRHYRRQLRLAKKRPRKQK